MKRSTNGRGCSIGGILVFVEMMMCVVTPAEANWSVTQLTNNSTHDIRPAISGTNVVWVGRDDFGQKIYSNFAGELSYVNDYGPDYYDGLFSGCNPDISGTNVVWEEGDLVRRLDGWLVGSGTRIYSNFAGVLTDFGEVDPAISGTNVVWLQWADQGIYSNFTGQLAQLTAGQYLNAAPDISGTNVVWATYEDPVSGGSAMNHIYSNFAGQLSAGYVSDYGPAISGMNVVWARSGTGIETNFAGAVTGANNLYNFPLTLGGTSPDISGTTIVWDGYDFSAEGDIEIYMATYTSDVVPAPGAVLLASLGAGLVGWLRRHRAL